MNEQTVDLIVIGAGPAGMSAAVEATVRGLSVVVLDEQGSAGGQIYRNVQQADAHQRRVLGSDYEAGAQLVAEFLQCGARFLSGAAIWQVTPERQVHFLIEGRAQILQGRHVLIATGAFERPMPIPGWTLPGVMTAGAGQILLKNAALVPQGPVVLAGCGPLLYLLAVQYLRAGVAIEALVDTSGTGDLVRAWREVPSALPGWRDLLKGLQLLATLKRAGVRHFRNARNFRVEGQEHAQALSFECGSRSWTLPASLVLLHQGWSPTPRSVGRCAWSTIGASSNCAGSPVATRRVKPAWRGSSLPATVGRLAALKWHDSKAASPRWRWPPVWERSTRIKHETSPRLTARPWLASVRQGH